MMEYSQALEDLFGYMESIQRENEGFKSLQKLLAKDIMTKGIVTISPRATINDAIEIFIENNISAVAVVDTQNNVIGVFSETNLVSFDQQRSQSQIQFSDLENYELFRSKIKAMEKGSFENEQVMNWMSQDIFSVDEADSFEDLCQMMVDKQVHRVFVKKNKNLVGIISSIDIARAIAQISYPKKKQDEDNSPDIYLHRSSIYKIDKDSKRS